VSHIKTLSIEENKKTLVHTDFGEIAEAISTALFIQAVKTFYYRIKISSCSDFSVYFKRAQY